MRFHTNLINRVVNCIVNNKKLDTLTFFMVTFKMNSRQYLIWTKNVYYI